MRWSERVLTYPTYERTHVERPVVAGMTVEDVAAAMNVPVVPVASIHFGGHDLIGRPPAYASIAMEDRVVVVYESELGDPVPGFSASRVRGMSDVLHELAHLMHEESFVDESSVAAWQALVITYLEPTLADELARDMEGYSYSWSGSPVRGSVGDFEGWIRSPEFEDLRRFAEQLGVVRGSEPLLRRVNP